MANQNDTAISVLNDLIETSKDGEKGFAFASRKVYRSFRYGTGRR